MVRVLVGVRGRVPRPTGHSLVTVFFMSVSVKDWLLHWVLVKSQTYYPEHILVYESRCRCFVRAPASQFIVMRVRLGWCAKGHEIYTGSGQMSLRPVCCCSCY